MGLFSCFFIYMQTLFFSLLLFHSTALAHFTSSQKSLCQNNERFALMQFKKSLIINENPSYFYVQDQCHPKSASWKRKEGNIDCCSWEGVECNEKTGHVIKLDLSNSCLHGSINSSSSLFHLVHLEWLNLAHNDFNDSKIPSAIVNLSKLSYLNLSRSSFSGQIPSEILQLSNLVSLDLSRNSEFYMFPLQLQKPSLGNLVEKLSNLKQLDLSDVTIASSIPHNLANLSNSLIFLSLHECQLQGKISPSLGNLTKLTHLDLSFNKLSGILPTSIGNLASLEQLDLSQNNISSELPTSIKNLASLKYLDLSFNKFSGIIPSSIGNLTNLVHLDLSVNPFSSELPPSFGNLVSLEKLDLSSNRLSGELPASIGNLTYLKTLDLSLNKFSGEMPISIGNLNSLEILFMSSCTLSSKLPPSLGNLAQLHKLALSFNNFSGELPASIGNIRSLEEMDVSGCSFSSQIPSSLNNLSQLSTLDLSGNNFSGTTDLDLLLTGLKNLEYLALSSNKLSLLTKASTNTTTQKLDVVGLRSCNITEFPNFLKSQHNLLALDLSSNKIQGEVPRWLLNISVQSLSYLNLSQNFLTGFDDQYPIVLPGSNQPFTLDLSSNNLHGQLPVPPPQIRNYLVSNNSLTGEIPAWICKSNILQALDLSYNNLSGDLPECLGYFSNQLSVLQLRGNKFSGSIPQTFKTGSRLRMIDLSNNLLQGRIPRSLTNCRQLEFLDLGNNQISDTFPSWLRTLPNLNVLILRSNRLHGTTRKNETGCGFPNLRIIDLSVNRFRGKLPSKYFECWNAMKLVNKSRLRYMEDIVYADVIPENDDFGMIDYSLTMSNKGKMMAYEKISNILVAIILSDNKFDGEVPESIANLKDLQILNLSNNNLQGHIPSSLSNLTNLESLDLSSNKLSGQIPQNFIELTFLEFFDVSHNNLTGPIPQGNQFTTFENSSFDGNSGLCGKPLSKKCENDSKTTGGAENEGILGSKFPFAFDWIIVLIGYSSGLVVGVILGLNFSTGIQEWFVEKFGKQSKRVRRKRRRRN